MLGIVDGNLRHGLAPAVDKLTDTLQILAGLSVGLTWFTNDDALHRLASHILAKIVEKLGSRNSCQPAGYELQRVGNCQSCTFLSVVNRKDTCHGLNHFA